MVTLSATQNEVPPVPVPEVTDSFLSFAHAGRLIAGSDLTIDSSSDLSATAFAYDASIRGWAVGTGVASASVYRPFVSLDGGVSVTDHHQSDAFIQAFRALGYTIFVTGPSGSDTLHVLGIESEPDLKAALQELASVPEEAKADEFPEPTSVAMGNAWSLLHRLYGLSPQRFVVYPMDDGEVVIDGGRPDRRLCVFCNSDGTVSCLGWIDGESRRFDAPGPDGVPAEFLVKSLSQPDGC